VTSLKMLSFGAVGDALSSATPMKTHTLLHVTTTCPASKLIKATLDAFTTLAAVISLLANTQTLKSGSASLSKSDAKVLTVTLVRLFAA
jgi:hypothetical protein